MSNLHLSDEEKANVRAVVFGHLAGIVLAPVVKALWDRRVFDEFDASSEWIEFDRILGTPAPTAATCELPCVS